MINPIENETSLINEVHQELVRIRNKRTRRGIIRNTVILLIGICALSILLANVWLPVLRVYGNTMAPTVEAGEIVLAVKHDKLKAGDLLAFYFNNRLLIKRVVGLPGDTVDIDKKGIVYINGKAIDEPYIQKFNRGEVTIKTPFQVPQERYFVLSDDRSSSIDSRNHLIGTVAPDQIVGKVFYRDGQ